MTRIEAPSRLHFGLLSLPLPEHTHWLDPDGKPGLPVRSFGGLGLMIDRPGVVVAVEKDDNWSCAGPGSERALQFARAFVGTLPESARASFRIRVEHCPLEHIGLGTGTSLALCVAKALAVELGHSDWDAVELARRVGRGKRSGVGVHGFQLGGLIVEAGKLPAEAIAPLVGRYDVPSEWRIVLFVPEQPSGWNGERERSALANLKRGNDTDTLCRIVITGILPALVSRDIGAFGAALSEFNLRAGRAFEQQQQGRYASPEIQDALALLRAEGAAGAGQSSWGPTIWGLLPDSRSASELAVRISGRKEFNGLSLIESGAAQQGAKSIGSGSNSLN